MPIQAKFFSVPVFQEAIRRRSYIGVVPSIVRGRSIAKFVQRFLGV